MSAERKPPWWAGGTVIAKRDVGWNLILTGDVAAIVTVKYDLRTGVLYCRLFIDPHEELRILER